MKILYIINDEFTEHSSVLKKINQQVEAWHQLGVQTHLVLIGLKPDASKDFVFSKNLNKLSYFDVKWLHFFGSLLYRHLNRAFFSFFIHKYYKASNADLIYMRQLQYSPFLNTFLKKHKTIVEVNTIYSNELPNYPAPIRDYIQNNEKKLFEAISGFVCVTQEVANTILKYNKPHTVCSNSANMKNYFERKPAEGVPRILMVCTPGMFWHGVESFVKMAKLLPEFQFDLVGATVDEQADNLTQHGIMQKGPLHELYQKVHIAVGPLSLYQKGMDESCSLKVREYLLNGLPIVIGEKDIDIYKKEYVLEIGNYKNNVIDSIDKIREFVNQFKNYVIPYQEVFNSVSTEIKEKGRVDFLSSIV